MVNLSLSPPSAPHVASGIATHCAYCALQCGMRLATSPEGVSVTGDDLFPVNQGALCIKGWTAASTLEHPDRLLQPLRRNGRGVLVRTTWDDAFDHIVRGIEAAQLRHGRDAVGIFGGGSLTNEKAYLLGKFARVALGTSQIDYNGRFCMSSAAVAAQRAFGIDRGLPFPLEDLSEADVILLVGGNPAETMPPLMRYFQKQRDCGGHLIVVDPRRTATARTATRHLRLAPGSDAVLANGLLHLLVREGWIDNAYVMRRTEGFEAVKAAVATYWPERVERLTGVAEADLVETARLLGSAPRIIILSGRGPEQQAQGVANVLAFTNLALALGLVGRPGSGFGSLTGQGNGQGGREHGQKADQLPGYRSISDPAARRHVAAVWGIAEAELPGPGRSAYEMLATLGDPEGVRTLLVFGSNILVSAPVVSEIEQRLQRLDLLVVSDFFLSETAQLADVVLPTIQWAEEEGTLTNLEGRVIHRRAAVMPPPGVRSDLEILYALAGRLGRGRYFRFPDVRDVFDELGRASAGGPADYSGIAYEKIDSQSGVYWPCPTGDHPGTPRLFQDSFPTPSGRARFHAVLPHPPAEERDAEYPLYLTTGRVLAHYQSGNQTRRIPDLQAIAPRPLVEVHPSVADRHGLRDGSPITLTTRRGSATFTLKKTIDIRPDTVFVPFHWAGREAANHLTNPALDPISQMPEFKVCAVRIEAATPVDTEHRE